MGGRAMRSSKHAEAPGHAEAVHTGVRDTVQQGTRAGGSPLPHAARVKMEERFGHDFGQVRVHDGPDANLSADGLAAHAYTVGSDIVFNQGKFNPDNADGEEMLTHELTHVIQQGGQSAASAGGELEISDPSDPAEQEAHELAKEMRGDEDSASPSAAPAASVHRWPWDDDDKKSGGGGGSSPGILDSLGSMASGAWDATKAGASAVGGAASGAYDKYQQMTDTKPVAAGDAKIDWTGKTPISWTQALGAGVDWMEKKAGEGLDAGAKSAEGIPVLEQLAGAGAFVGKGMTNLTGGVIRGAGDIVGGIENVFAHPIDSAAGIEGILEHNSTIPFMGSTLKAIHGAYDIATDKKNAEYGNSWGDLANHVFNPMQQMKDDQAFDSNLARGIVAPGTKDWGDAWNHIKENPMDALGRAGTNVLPMVMGMGEAGAGEAAGEGSGAARAAGEGGAGAGAKTLPGLGPPGPPVKTLPGLGPPGPELPVPVEAPSVPKAPSGGVPEPAVAPAEAPVAPSEPAPAAPRPKANVEINANVAKPGQGNVQIIKNILEKPPGEAPGVPPTERGPLTSPAAESVPPPTEAVPTVREPHVVNPSGEPVVVNPNAPFFADPGDPTVHPLESPAAKSLPAPPTVPDPATIPGPLDVPPATVPDPPTLPGLGPKTLPGLGVPGPELPSAISQLDPALFEPAPVTPKVPSRPPGVPAPEPFNPDIPVIEPEPPTGPPRPAPAPEPPAPNIHEAPSHVPSGEPSSNAFSHGRLEPFRHVPEPSVPPGFENVPRPFPAPREPVPLPDQTPSLGSVPDPATIPPERPPNTVVQEPQSTLPSSSGPSSSSSFPEVPSFPSSEFPAPTIPDGPPTIREPDFSPKPPGAPIAPEPIPKLPGGPKEGPPIPREEPLSRPADTPRQPIDIPGSIPPPPDTIPDGPITQDAPSSSGSETPTLRGLGGVPAIPRGFDPGALIQLMLDTPGAGSVVELMQQLGMPTRRA